MSEMSTKKIAITGTIGSGKSTVTNIIKEVYPTISSDDIVSTLYLEDSFVKEVNKLLFNEDSYNLDKGRIAHAIFNDVALKEKLEAFIHPLVKEKIQQFFKKHEGLVFVEVPLLFEANFDTMFDEIIVVVADENVVYKRLMENRGYTKEEVFDRISNQYPKEVKISKANYVIYNNEGLDMLKYNVDKLIRKIESDR